jgi:hypothetical protein
MQGWAFALASVDSKPMLVNSDAVVAKFKALRASWRKLQGDRRRELRKLGLDMKGQEIKKSKQAARRDQREAVYAAEIKSRSSEVFQPERGVDQGEGEYADYREAILKVELRAQGEVDGQADRRRPPTDRPPDKVIGKGAFGGVCRSAAISARQQWSERQFCPFAENAN